MSEGNPVIPSGSAEAKLGALLVLAKAQGDQTKSLAGEMKDHREEFTRWKDHDFREVRERVIRLESQKDLVLQTITAGDEAVGARVDECLRQHADHASKADIVSVKADIASARAASRGGSGGRTALKYLAAIVGAIAVAVPSTIAAMKNSGQQPAQHQATPP